jgi:hypothetical protein
MTPNTKQSKYEYEPLPGGMVRHEPIIWACICEERKKPINERKWVVYQRHCNHSAFNGYHWTPSDYSSIRCLECEHIWRTKARYVDSLRDAKGNE